MMDRFALCDIAVFCTSLAAAIFAYETWAYAKMLSTAKAQALEANRQYNELMSSYSQLRNLGGGYDDDSHETIE